MKSVLYTLLIGFIFSQPTIDWFVEYNGSGEESHGHFI